MKKLLILIVLIIAGWGVFALMQRASSTHYEALIDNEDAVLLMDQKDGEDIVVSYAKLSKPGYVVLYGEDASGNPTVLGTSTYLKAGAYTNVRIHRGTVSHTTKTTAKIVHDDGDKAFDADVDVVATDEGVDVDSEATVSEDGQELEDISEEELTELLDEEGYDVSGGTEDDDDDTIPEDTMDDDGVMDDGSEATTSDEVMDEGSEATTSDEVMEDDGTGTTTEESGDGMMQ